MLYHLHFTQMHWRFWGDTNMTKVSIPRFKKKKNCYLKQPYHCFNSIPFTFLTIGLQVNIYWANFLSFSFHQSTLSPYESTLYYRYLFTRFLNWQYSPYVDTWSRSQFSRIFFVHKITIQCILYIIAFSIITSCLFSSRSEPLRYT